MNHSSYNNRRIIWESKTKQLWLILGSITFVAVIIWIGDKSSSFMFWSGLLFFGSCGIFILVRLLNPKNLFVSPQSELGKHIFSEQVQNDQDNLGLFIYDETGFKLKVHNKVTHYNWADIETVFGFKEDHYTTDEICLDIFFRDKIGIHLTESTPGWHQFNNRLCKVIPTVSENWETEIMLPAFATNMTLLFDIGNRSIEQAEKTWYIN